MECQVCKKHKTLQNLPGGAIYRDSEIFIAHFPEVATEPAHYGHVIIELSRHLSSPAEMSAAEAAQVGIYLQKVSSALERILFAEHVYIVRIGDQTPHLHFHLVPRFKDTPKSEWGPLLFRSKLTRKASADEMIEITSKLKAALQE